MRRSLIRVLMHFRGLLWRKGPKRIPRAGGDTSTSSKVRRCKKTLGRGNQSVHQCTRGGKDRWRGSTPSETNERLRLNLVGCSTALQVLRESATRRTDPRAGRVLRLSPCC